MDDKKPIIFLVDDTPINLKLGKRVLEEQYKVITLDSGEQMFEALAFATPDLILLDVLMPGMGGFGAIKLLKSNEDTVDIPVIFLSSVTGVDEEYEGLTLGAVDYISKPFAPKLLLKRIEFHLLLQSQKQELETLNSDLTQIVSKQIKEKVDTRSFFSKYIDSSLINQFFMNRDDTANVAGTRQQVAVLFADVRGFTAMAESLDATPEIVVEVLNDLLEITATAIANNGGSVDKFVGDETMGLFNGYIAQDDYVFSAVKAAWEIIHGATEVLESIEKRVGIVLGFGIGIHCGEAIIGSIGPSFRKDYTAIGDTVNVASRLESQAGISEILISRSVCDELEGRVDAVSVGKMTLKGKKELVEVFLLNEIIQS